MKDNFNSNKPENHEDDIQETGKFDRIDFSDNQEPSESKFDTEKFYARDAKYKEEKIGGYSHYSDYNQDELNEEESLDLDSRVQEDPADSFFAKDESPYRDNISTEDVERIVAKRAKENKTPWWKFLLSTILGGLLGVILLFAVGPAIAEYLGIETQPLDNSTFTISPEDDINAEVAVFEKVKDSVVGITTVVPTANNFLPIGSYSEGVGSGVIVSEDGYILTNSHVVSDGQAQTINVILDNQESYEGQLVWFEPEMDLAVVKVEAQGLKPVELGDSGAIRVGQKAIAIGNPLGLDLQSTLTSGFISGLDRSITMETGLTMDGLIQTDAAINSGNSGGALLNAQGQLIGINTAKASADNIGFAIPINTAKVVINRIETSASFEPVTLGVSAVGLDYYESVTGLESEVEDGLMVIEVVPGSAASQGGIQQGDIITSIDGVATNSMGILRTQLLAYEPGDQAELTIIRDNVSETINVVFSGQAI